MVSICISEKTHQFQTQVRCGHYALRIDRPRPTGDSAGFFVYPHDGFQSIQIFLLRS